MPSALSLTLSIITLVIFPQNWMHFKPWEDYTWGSSISFVVLQQLDLRQEIHSCSGFCNAILSIPFEQSFKGRMHITHRLQDINVWTFRDCQESEVSRSFHKGKTLKAKEDKLHVTSNCIYMQMLFTYVFFLMRSYCGAGENMILSFCLPLSRDPRPLGSSESCQSLQTLLETCLRDGNKI